MNRFQYFFYGLFFLCLLSACTVVEKTLKPDNTAEYAELLFKRQNGLTQQLMMLFDEDVTEPQMSVISQAELDMYDACHLLNEMAGRELDGKPLTLFFKAKLRGSFSQCDQSVQQLESILISMGLL